MQFDVIDPARIEREWPVLAEVLAPALRADPTQTLEGLHTRLGSCADSLLAISGPGHALMVIEVTDGLVCWIKYLAGKIEGGPKARAAIMAGAVNHIEAMARGAGCSEIRLCGRDWSKIISGYEPLDGHRNGLKKEL